MVFELNVQYVHMLVGSPGRGLYSICITSIVQASPTAAASPRPQGEGLVVGVAAHHPRVERFR
jgi:hypothetical protein